jgi:hypothetical protein
LATVTAGARSATGEHGTTPHTRAAPACATLETSLTTIAVCGKRRPGLYTEPTAIAARG